MRISARLLSLATREVQHEENDADDDEKTARHCTAKLGCTFFGSRHVSRVDHELHRETREHARENAEAAPKRQRLLLHAI